MVGRQTTGINGTGARASMPPAERQPDIMPIIGVMRTGGVGGSCRWRMATSAT